jgi:hypothetical protein
MTNNQVPPGQVAKLPERILMTTISFRPDRITVMRLEKLQEMTGTKSRSQIISNAIGAYYEKIRKELEMSYVYIYHDGEYLGKVLTNRSLTTQEALALVGVDPNEVEDINTPRWDWELFAVHDEPLYDLVQINRSPSDSAWQCGNANTDEPYDLYEWRTNIQGDGFGVYRLGEDKLPSGIDDIRGLIHNEPDVVFAVVDLDGNVSYTGANLILS